jgi:hypothetical protein
MKGLGTQDCAIQESMGAISDRSLEHLLPSDAAIVKIRRLLLQTLKDNATASAARHERRKAIACAPRGY